DLVEEAGDACADLDRLRGLQPASEVHELATLARLGLAGGAQRGDQSDAQHDSPAGRPAVEHGEPPRMWVSAAPPLRKPAERRRRKTIVGNPTPARRRQTGTCDRTGVTM